MNDKTKLIFVQLNINSLSEFSVSGSFYVEINLHQKKWLVNYSWPAT